MLGIGLLSVAVIAGGCGGSPDPGRAGATARPYTAGAISVVIPPGWHQVPVRDLPGADVALQIASSPVRGALTDICSPGRRIIDQLPPRGALLQLLDYGPRFRQRPGIRDEFPRLRKPFHLGRTRSYECGSGYNIFFYRGGRSFQLRIWTGSRSPRKPWAPTKPTARLRRQIELLVNSLQVRPTSTGANASSSPRPTFRRCPPPHGDHVGAGGWGGSVIDISCPKAGWLILHRFAGDDPHPGWGSGPIRTATPAEFRSAGFDCGSFPLVDGGAWHVLCQRGTEKVSYFFTP
jgi:hypothetical protein